MNYKLRLISRRETKKDIEKFLLDSPYKKVLDLKPVGTGKSLDVSIFAKSVNDKCLVIQPRKELLKWIWKS